MARIETKTVRITDWERLNNSVSGGPKFRVRFDDATTFISQSDAAWCHGFGVNKGLRTDDKVTITLTRAGYISHMVPAKD